MSKHFQQLLKALKTSDEVKALGFNKEEIKSLASDMDKNLKIDENASDEDVESAIDEAVEHAIPFLKMAQKSSSRIVKKALEKKKEDDDDDDDDDEPNDDDEPDGEEKPKDGKKTKKERNRAESEDSEIKKMLTTIMKKMEKQDETIANLRKGNTTDKRRAKLEKLLKDTGTFGKRTLRQFDKMDFEDDDEFEDFLDDVKADLEEANQERANAGLAKLGAVPTPDKGGKEDKPEEITDNELDKLADML